MAVTSFTPILGLALPTTGDLSGTWGTTVNSFITSYLDGAIAGTNTIALTSNISLTKTVAPASLGSSSSQYAILNVTPDAIGRTLTVPATSKIYVVNNLGSYSFTLKALGQTGIVISAGEKCVAAFTGIDFTKIANYNGSGLFSSVTISSIPTDRVIYTTSGGALTSSANITFNGTSLSTNLSGCTSVPVNQAINNLPVANLNSGTNAGTNTFWRGDGVWEVVSPDGPDTSIVYNAAGTLGGDGAFTYDGNQIYLNSIFIGPGANASTTSYSNLGIGADTLQNVTTGLNSVAVGSGALEYFTSGDSNVAVGKSAAQNMDAGASNVAVGNQTLYNASGAVYDNVAVGYNALYSAYNSSGAQACNNTAIGSGSLLSSTTGSSNTALGYQSLYSLTTSSNNVGLGHQSIYSLTTGSSNVGLGYQSLYNLTTGGNNVAIGNLAGTDTVINITNQSNRIVIGNDSSTNAYIKVAWTVVSDARDKTSIAAVPHGLSFIASLTPISYQFKTSRKDETATGPVRYGFKAQDILALEGANPVIIDNTDPDHLKYNESSMIAVLCNAIKELKSELDLVKAELLSLKGN